MSEPAPMKRRALFGYAGVAGAGAAAGLVAGRASGLERPSNEKGPHGLPIGEGVTRQRYDPHGLHQSGILTPAPASHRVLALDLLGRTDAEALARLMRVWSSTIAALMAGRPAPGDATPDLAQEAVSLTITVGFGPGVFRLPGLESKRPAGFQDIPPMDHDKLQERWSGGDLLVMVQADDETSVAYACRRMTVDARPFATPRWSQSGSWRGVDSAGNPITGRNHFGQVDGSRNPLPEELGQALWSTDGWLADGTQLVVRRIEMDLDDWDALVRDRQEKAVGRNLLDGAPLTGGAEKDDIDREAVVDGQPVLALDAHVRRAHPAENHGRRMLRRSVNYTHVDDAGQASAGLLFMALQSSIAEQFIPVQQTLDASDALNEWTTAIGSAVFALPPGFTAERHLAAGLFD
ncbi:MAG: Dyp-type peroxidase [Propionibacteriaceae bacterium]|nr:Dyp-type peroxidase [Propionibacteriaceae bacterium]